MTEPTMWFDDFVVGDVLPLGEKTVTAEEIIAFARDYHPAPMHLDDALAKAAFHARHEIDTPGRPPIELLMPLEGLVASPWHVGAMFMRTFYDGLLVRASSLGSPGIETLDWPNPVKTGDAVRFSLEVMEIRPSRSRPDLGLVLFDSLGANQLGDPVMLARSWTMFGRRPDASATDEVGDAVV